MSSRAILLTLAYFFMVGCGEWQGNKYQAEKIIVSSQDFEAIDNLTKKNSLFSSIFNSGKYAYVEDGYLCLLQMKDEETPLTLEIWDINHKNLFYKYDSREDDLILPFFTRNGANFTIHDNLTQKILNININDAIHNNSYHPQVFSSNIISERITPWGDRVLYLNPNSYENVNERVCFSKKNWCAKETKKGYNSSNVIHGELLSNPGLSSIAFVPYNFNTIEVFNENKALVKEISLPHENIQRVSNAEFGGEKMYFYLAPLIKCFSAACAGKTLLAVGFIDDAEANYLVVIDWEGNMMKKFNTGGIIRSLSIDSQEHTIYSWERHEDMDILFSYQID